MQVKRMVSDHPELAYSRDSNGRAAMDVASKTIKVGAALDINLT